MYFLLEKVKMKEKKTCHAVEHASLRHYEFRQHAKPRTLHTTVSHTPEPDKRNKRQPSNSRVALCMQTYVHKRKLPRAKKKNKAQDGETQNLYNPSPDRLHEYASACITQIPTSRAYTRIVHWLVRLSCTRAHD